MWCLHKTKNRLDFFDKKSFEKLPHIENLIGKITLVKGMWKYQDIPLLNFDNVFACIKNKKDSFPRKIWTCIQSTLEEEDDSEILFTHVLHFWNTGGFEKQLMTMVLLWGIWSLGMMQFHTFTIILKMLWLTSKLLVIYSDMIFWHTWSNFFHFQFLWKNLAPHIFIPQK